MPGIKFLPALGKPNVAWVFKGEDYGTIEWAPGSVPGVVLQSTESIFYNWPSLREAGFIRVDAAVNMYDEAWIFYGNKMAAITIPNNNSDSMLTQGPYPLSEWDSLKELGFTSIDALHAVPNHPGEYFVFSGLNYARICRSRHVDKVISGPKPILENWILPFVSIDTVLPHPTNPNDLYFFAGSQYVCVTINLETNRHTVQHEPYSIARNWPALVQLGFFDPCNVLMSADFDIQGGRTTVWEVRKAPLGMPTTSHLATFLGMNHLGANHMPARLNTLWRIPDSNTLILADAIHLEEVLGAEGNKLYWGGKNFHELAKKVETTGNLVSDPDAEVPKVALEVTFDHGWDSINLSGILELNSDHSVTALVPTLIEVRRQHLEEVTKIMDAYLTQHAKGMQVVRVSPPTSGDVPVEGETWYTTAKSGTQDVAFGVKAHTAEAKAVVTHLTGKHFEGDFLSVEASAHAEPLGYFAEAGAYGAKVKYGGLELDGGLAVGVGAGIKDGSVTVEAGIFDITVGKKMGIHLLGFGFSGEVCTIM